MRKARIWLLGLTAALAMGASADAAMIDRTFNIDASRFTFGGGGIGVPVDQLHFDFRVAFDNSSTFGPTSAGLTVLSSNGPGGAVIFSYDAEDDLIFAGTSLQPNGAGCGAAIGTFCLLIAGGATGPTPSLFGVTQSVASLDPNWSNGLYDAANTSFSFVDNRVVLTEDSGGVPEPATWAMLILGFGAAGATLRATRSRAAPAV